MEIELTRKERQREREREEKKREESSKVKRSTRAVNKEKKRRLREEM